MLQDGEPERSYTSAAQVARSKDLMTWTDGKSQDSAPFMGWPGPQDLLFLALVGGDICPSRNIPRLFTYIIG